LPRARRACQADDGVRRERSLGGSLMQRLGARTIVASIIKSASMKQLEAVTDLT
jgi:hypothetical protein